MARGIATAAEITGARSRRDAERAEQQHANVVKARRVLTMVALVVGFPLGLVVGVVLSLVVGVAIGLPVAAVVVCAVGFGAARYLSKTATERVIRALGAQPGDETTLVRAYNQVEGLCATMGLAMPDIMVVDRPHPNALLIGTDQTDTCLVLTRTLVDTLTPVQLEAVMAHELTHLERGDMAPATLVCAALLMAGRKSGSKGDALRRVAGSGRELTTDMLAVSVTRYPPGLADALSVLHSNRQTNSATLLGVDSLVRWLWTCPVGPLPEGAEAVGNLDLPDVRIAALAEL